jgi:hypothetical protein
MLDANSLPRSSAQVRSILRFSRTSASTEALFSKLLDDSKGPNATAKGQK